MQNKVLFLDRDGTINVDYGYVGSPDRFEFIDGIFDLCRTAMTRGYKIIVITNQSGIARGYFTDADFHKLTAHMCAEFARHGIDVLDVFYCPELAGPNRKPNPGMFIDAMKKHDIDMKNSVSVGDRDRDIDAAVAAGVGRNFLFNDNFSEIQEKL